MMRRSIHLWKELAAAWGPRNTPAARDWGYLGNKPIVKTPPPRELVNNTPPDLLKRRKKSAKTNKLFPSSVQSPKVDDITRLRQDVVDALCHHMTWTSTTARAGEEAQIPHKPVTPPKSTFEENSDLVKYRPHKYESEAATWQRTADAWDCVQCRPRIDKPLTRAENGIKQDRPSQQPPLRKSSQELISVGEQITGLMKSNKLASSYERPCPGYAGFVPRSPIESKLEKLPDPQGMITVMKASYRGLPKDSYAIQKFAHKGPMSRTVTLTYPYNSFNKVEATPDFD